MWETFVRENDYRTGLELGEGPFSVRAVLLRDLAGTLDWPTQPGLTFMHELEGRIRVICGLDRSPILTEGNDALRDHVDAGSNDSVLLVWGPGEDTLQAAEEIRIRYTEASEGVPNETRQYRPDGSTDFERILPGPDRMYPDTDSPPTKVTTARVEGLRDVLAEAPWSREERYSKAGVPMETIHYLIRLGGADLVDRVVRTGADVRQACFFFGEQLKGLRRKGVEDDQIPPVRWEELFGSPLHLEAWPDVVRRLAANPNAKLSTEAAGDWQVSLDGYMPHRQDSKVIRIRYELGRAMKKLRGRVRVEEVRRAIEEKLECLTS